MPVRSMRMRHANGSATTTAEKISVNRGIGQYIAITNLDATNSIDISFDNGANYFSILPADPTFKVSALFHFFLVKSDVTAAWTALLGEG